MLTAENWKLMGCKLLEHQMYQQMANSSDIKQITASCKISMHNQYGIKNNMEQVALGVFKRRQEWSWCVSLNGEIPIFQNSHFWLVSAQWSCMKAPEIWWTS